jgi:hypothetical protein
MLRKLLKVFAGIMVILALFGINAGCVLATGEQSVKELIGRDGDYLVKQMLMQKLTASDGAGGDFFGYTVAISGNEIIVGAYRDDDKGSS